MPNGAGYGGFFSVRSEGRALVTKKQRLMAQPLLFPAEGAIISGEKRQTATVRLYSYFPPYLGCVLHCNAQHFLFCLHLMSGAACLVCGLPICTEKKTVYGAGFAMAGAGSYNGEKQEPQRAAAAGRDGLRRDGTRRFGRIPDGARTANI